MRGKITKGIGGFYSVLTEEGATLVCSVKGAFRKKNITPYVGDNVVVKLEEDSMHGLVVEIEARENFLVRPPVANVSQAMIVFACEAPKPNLMVLDKLTAICENKDLNIILCFNKTDLADHRQIQTLKDIYEKTPYETCFFSAQKDKLKLMEMFQHHTTVLAGPSGVGKSTILNAIDPSLELATGEVSEKIGRGRHTTRHVELLSLAPESYVLDTPGFTAVDVTEITLEDIRYAFAEFDAFYEECKFTYCRHDSEPGCAVKEAVEKGVISAKRYENYLKIKDEIIQHDREKKR